MLRRYVTFEWVVGLDMARGSFETDGIFVKTAVMMNVSKLLALEAGLVVVEMIMGEEYIMVAICPLDFGVSDGNLLFQGQGK